VARELEKDIAATFAAGEHAIIDTHFAAKLHGTHYRIGLSRELIFKLARGLFASVAERGQSLHAAVVLIDANPHCLLTRRREDTSRNREIDPADCVRALQRNRMCVGQYASEFARAKQSCSTRVPQIVSLDIVMNEEILDAKRRLISAVWSA